MYIRPLQNADPPIIPHDRLGDFMQDVFYNWAELHLHHRRLLDTLFEIQREEHPRIRSVTAPVFDGALNFREAYMEYIPNYPIAEYRIEDEMRRNPIFKEFADVCSDSGCTTTNLHLTFLLSDLRATSGCAYVGYEGLH